MFYVPLLYAIETRFLKRSKLGFLVWVTEYFFPVLLSLFFIISFPNLLIPGIIGIITVYNLYEIGYIQNDCETIKVEKKPTLRISKNELSYYENHKYYIYIIRIFLSIILSIYHCFCQISVTIVIISWMILPLFFIYNKIRGRMNLYLILLLTTYRYLMPLFLTVSYYDKQFILIAIVLFVSYPLIKWIEVCAGGKSLPPEVWTRLFLKSYESRFLFRIKYYVVLTLFFIGVSSTIGYNYIWLLPLYYFILRLFQYRMPKLGPR